MNFYNRTVKQSDCFKFLYYINYFNVHKYKLLEIQNRYCLWELGDYSSITKALYRE